MRPKIMLWEKKVISMDFSVFFNKFVKYWTKIYMHVYWLIAIAMASICK